MKIAILSDIHANLEALTKALEEIDRQHADTIACLGDIVGYGANPNECVEIVRERCRFVVLGNHDAAVFNDEYLNYFNDTAREAAVWTSKIVTSANKQFLKNLPLTIRSGDALFVHASPCEPDQWSYLTDEQDEIAALSCTDAPCCFIGHTHVPTITAEAGRQKKFSGRKQHIVNVGSVGQPRDHNPLLSFGIFDDKAWTYQDIRLAYDINGAMGKILGASLPPILAYRLKQGI